MPPESSPMKVTDDTKGRAGARRFLSVTLGYPTVSV